MKKFRGLFETSLECEAETEEEAIKILCAMLIERIEKRDIEPIVWEEENGENTKL